MPIRHTIDVAAHIATLHYDGDPTFEEFAEAIARLVGDPEFRIGFGVLADRRSVPAPSVDYIRRVLDFMRANGAGIGASPWATLVSSPAGYGMGRMSKGLGGDLQTPFDVFTEPDAALEWLREKVSAL